MAYPSDLVRTKNWGTEVLTDSDLEGQFDLIINWVMAALNSSTGHSHSGSGNNGPRLASSAVTTTFGNGFTTVTGASSDYLLIASDVSDSNTTKKALASDFVYVPSASNALAGSVVQVQYAENTTYSLITANIAYDAGYPEVTEGAQVLSRTITPTNASNKLLIEVLLQVGTAGTQNVTAAVFKDGATNAIAAGYEYITVNESGALKVRKYIDAGSTSEQTFTVRMGGPSNNTEINGANGALKHGGALISSITITEIKV